METELSRAVNMNDDSLITDTAMRHEICLSTRILNAALAGDWEEAEEIIERYPNIITASITPSGETALHIAASVAESKHENFVEKLLDKIPDNERVKTNTAGSTALHFAAISGNKKIAQLMVNGNTELPRIFNENEASPLLLAAISGNGEMVEYLLPLSDFGYWIDDKKSELLTTCIEAGLYGVAQNIIESNPTLALAEYGNKGTPLYVLVRKPSTFSSITQPGWWTRTICALSPKKVAKEESSDVFRLLERILQQVPQMDIENPTICADIALPVFAAAELGKYEFLVELLRQRPEFLYIIDHCNYTIFHIAVKHRHESIFSLIYEIGKLKDFIATYRDKEDNTMLHLAANVAAKSQSKTLPGAALQMHHELLWYKEVEKVVPPTYRNMKNKNNKTPHELFTENHKFMMEEGEKWMKKTAQSCMVVATLIATVVFTAAFTVPGGYNNNNNENSGGSRNIGEPILQHEMLFTVFTAADAIAMLSSIISVIMFLVILTSRYAEEDFLELPTSLAFGIMTLFFSLAGMMVAFCASLILYGQHEFATALTLLGLFAFVPIIFVIVKYRLLTDIIIWSIFATKRMFRSRQRLISK